MTCFATGACGPVLDAVDETLDETLDEVVPGFVAEGPPGVTGKPVVALMPGGVSASGAGVALWADGGANAPRRAAGRRFTLVETNPVAPAPEPGALA